MEAISRYQEPDSILKEKDEVSEAAGSTQMKMSLTETKFLGTVWDVAHSDNDRTYLNSVFFTLYLPTDFYWHTPNH